METRANYIWVGAVTLLLLGLLAVFIGWHSSAPPTAGITTFSSRNRWAGSRTGLK